ncbi:MAG: hypothetical protein ABFS39_06785 [Pseudomonadota bacterium]
MHSESDNKSTHPTPWEKEHNRIKTLWVISVLFFWFSAFFQIGLFIVDGQVNFILISIIGGMMVLGVALKLRLQHHLRNKPDK